MILFDELIEMIVPPTFHIVICPEPGNTLQATWTNVRASVVASYRGRLQCYIIRLVCVGSSRYVCVFPISKNGNQILGHPIESRKRTQKYLPG